MITAYDYTMARLVDEAGVEGVLVGDTMAQVVQGHENTLPVTLDEMIYHAEMVGRAVNHALMVVDMPFPSYHIGKNKAIKNAGRILKKTRCQAVKLEGGADQADTIRALTSAGIPVMAHCGLCPQSVHQLGGYRVQRDEKAFLPPFAHVAFEPGDILVGCTLLNDPDDDHAGEGRIRQYDQAMQLKGELWTEGGHHLIGGL